MRSNKLIAILFILISFACSAGDHKAIFDSANSAYASGKYENAIKMYESVLQDGMESSVLYFNLGNAYYKTNNIGKAILNYERAKKLDPNDEDVLTNLKLANQKIEDKIESAPQLFLSQWENGIIDAMSEKQWSITLIIIITIALGLLAVYLFSSHKGFRQLGFFGGAFLAVISVLIFFMAKSKYNSTINSASAIIDDASVTVTASPSEKGTRLFILHEGTKVNILEMEADWSEIRIANGNVGWIKTSALEKI
jgi:tetratricopeptide (TPR) repeat protein